jgi:hypothetical protein
MRLHTFAAFSVLLFALQGAFGQTKLPIYVQSQGTDVVGKGVAFSLREAIRRSASYELADDEAETVLHVGVISVEAETGRSSVISFVGSATVAPCGDRHLFLHRLLKVGLGRADEAGKQILVDLDDAWAAAKREMKRRHDEDKCEGGSTLK